MIGSEEKSKTSWDTSIPVKVLGLGIGAIIAKTFGANLWMPLIGILIVWALLNKFGSMKIKPYAPALAVQGGHLLWFLLGAALLGQFSQLAVDIALMTFGLAWLAIRPGRPALVCLMLYQAILTAINVKALMVVANAYQPALIIHIVLRLGAIFCMWRAWTPRPLTATPTATPQATSEGNPKFRLWMKERFWLGNGTGTIPRDTKAGVAAATCIAPWVLLAVGGPVWSWTQNGPISWLVGGVAMALAWKPLTRLFLWAVAGAGIPVVPTAERGISRLGHVLGILLTPLLVLLGYVNIVGSGDRLSPIPMLMALGPAVATYIIIRLLTRTAFWVRDGFLPESGNS